MASLLSDPTQVCPGEAVGLLFTDQWGVAIDQSRFVLECVSVFVCQQAVDRQFAEVLLGGGAIPRDPRRLHPRDAVSGVEGKFTRRRIADLRIAGLRIRDTSPETGESLSRPGSETGVVLIPVVLNVLNGEHGQLVDGPAVGFSTLLVDGACVPAPRSGRRRRVVLRPGSGRTSSRRPGPDHGRLLSASGQGYRAEGQSDQRLPGRSDPSSVTGSIPPGGFSGRHSRNGGIHGRHVKLAVVDRRPADPGQPGLPRWRPTARRRLRPAAPWRTASGTLYRSVMAFIVERSSVKNGAIEGWGRCQPAPSRSSETAWFTPDWLDRFR